MLTLRKQHWNLIVILMLLVSVVSTSLFVAPERAHAQASATITVTSSAPKTSSCRLLSSNFINCVLLLAANTWLWLISWILAFFGWVFEMVAYLSVIKFADIANSDFIRLGWVRIRDVCNLFFIFLMLWTAIKTVVGIEGNAKKAVTNIIIAALVMNFSFAATRVVIDAGNVLALYFYNDSKGTSDWGISGRVMTALKVPAATELIRKNSGSTPTSGSATIASKAGPLDIAVQTFGATIYILAAAILLAVAAGLFLYRMVILLFLLMTAAYPVLSYAATGNMDPNGWFTKLWQQAMVAPIFFLIFSVALRVVEGINSAKIFDTSLPWGAGQIMVTVQTAISFIVSIFMLFAALSVSQSLGGDGGKKLADWGKGKITDYSKRSGAWLGRNTIGRGAAVAANASRPVAARLASIPLAGGAVRAAYGGLAGVATKAKFGGAQSFTDRQKAEAESKEAFATQLEKGVGVGAKKNEKARDAYLETLKKEAEGRKKASAGVAATTGAVVGGLALGPVGAAVGAAVGGALGGLAGRADVTSKEAAKNVNKKSAQEELDEKRKARNEKKSDLKALQDEKKELEEKASRTPDEEARLTKLKQEETQLTTEVADLNKQVGEATEALRKLTKGTAGAQPRMSTVTTVAAANGNTWRSRLGSVVRTVTGGNQAPQALDLSQTPDDIQGELTRIESQIRDLESKRPDNRAATFSPSARNEQVRINTEISRLRAEGDKTREKLAARRSLDEVQAEGSRPTSSTSAPSAAATPRPSTSTPPTPPSASSPRTPPSGTPPTA